MNNMENLRYILTRLDGYLESSQNKSNLYLVLNTIVLGGVITIITVLKDLNCNWLLKSLLLIIAIASIVSILITLFVINPYTKSALQNKQSIFFFKDIANIDSLSNCQKMLEDTIKNNENVLINDISSQIYSVAQGLNSKYKRLRLVGNIIASEFLLLAIWIIILLINKTI